MDFVLSRRKGQVLYDRANVVELLAQEGDVFDDVDYTSGTQDDLLFAPVASKARQ